MITEDDVLEHEIWHLTRFIENKKVPLLRRLLHSRPALLTIAAMVLLFQMRDLPETLANSSLDAAIAIQKPVQARAVRLVEIDDKDYEDMFRSRSPLDPTELSGLLEAIAKGHPRAIVVDIDTFDPMFKSMATPAVPIVWNVSGDEQQDGKFTIDPPLGGRVMPPDSTMALAVAPQDDRGVVRGYQLAYPLKKGGTVDSPGYAAAVLAAGHAPDSADPAGKIHYLDYRYRFVPIKARDLVADAQSSDVWEKMRLFDGQVVVLGGSYRYGRDQYATPKGLMNGCDIIAQAVAAEMEGTAISAASRWTTGLMLVLGGLTTLAVYHWLKFRTAFLVSLAMIPLLSIASNWVLFHRLAAWGAMVPLVIAVIVAELYSKAVLYLTFYQRVAKLRAGNAEAVEADEV